MGTRPGADPREVSIRQGEALSGAEGSGGGRAPGRLLGPPLQLRTVPDTPDIDAAERVPMSSRCHFQALGSCPEEGWRGTNSGSLTRHPAKGGCPFGEGADTSRSLSSERKAQKEVEYGINLSLTPFCINGRRMRSQFHS